VAIVIPRSFSSGALSISASGQRRLAMVDVTDGPDVDVRLVALELLLRHFEFAPVSTCMPASVEANLRNLSNYGLS
jgi:hypothetical protein